MIKKLPISILSILMIGLMFSCSTSNDVASNRGIQKRKYNKGFYVEKGPKLGGSNKQVEQVENENTIVENTEAIEEPTERISSLPEVVFVEDELTDDVLLLEEDKDVKVTTEKAEEVTNLETAVTESIPLRKMFKKGLKKVVQKVKSPAPLDMTQGGSESGLFLVLLVVLAIILPPLAVFIYAGVGRPFWIDLVLWLVAIGVGSALFGLGVGFLCGLIAVIYALLIIFDVV